jgi:hypothetical protein
MPHTLKNLLMISTGHQMRLLAANHIVHEVKEDTYAPTTYSFGLGDKSTQLAPGLRIRYVAAFLFDTPLHRIV